MARFNEIQVGRYNRFIQKIFSIKGPPSMAQVAAELQPVFTFFNGAENRYLENWNRFGQSMLGTAVAAQNVAFRMRNPATSNVIAVIEKAAWSNVTAAPDQPFMQENAGTTDLAGIFTITAARFDSRGSPQPSCVLSGGNNTASIGGSKMQAALAANSTYDFIGTDIQEFPLLPGDILQFVSTAVNIAPFMNIWWRERFLEDSEVK